MLHIGGHQGNSQAGYQHLSDRVARTFARRWVNLRDMAEASERRLGQRYKRASEYMRQRTSR